MNKTENINEITSGILNEIINKIVDQKREQEQKTEFVEQIFETIIQIILKSHNCTNSRKLKEYEYYRYSNIILLLKTFIAKMINLNIIDTKIKDKLYSYLGYTYVESNYYKILKNISYTFNEKNISIIDYSTPKISKIKTILLEHVNKQYLFIGMLQNKELLCTIDKEILDDLFYKIIFELTIYITYL